MQARTGRAGYKQKAVESGVVRLDALHSIFKRPHAHSLCPKCDIPQVSCDRDHNKTIGITCMACGRRAISHQYISLQ